MAANTLLYSGCERPDREPALGLSVLGHCRNVAAQHGALCVSGSVLSLNRNILPHSQAVFSRLF